MKRALLSVSDKTGITELAHALTKAGYEIISTGNTHKQLLAEGIPAIAVEEVTGFPECMDGRVKTLHPAIFGGLLGIPDNPGHKASMAAHKIGAIDVLAVNLYPFVAKPSIENIDVGGPAMLRAAAKNHEYLAVLTAPADYPEFIRRLEEGTVDTAYRRRLAAKTFAHTAMYDSHIAGYFNALLLEESGEAAEAEYPQNLTLAFEKVSSLRYGENPHQSASYYKWSNANFNRYHSVTSCPEADSRGIESAEILNGKELSYNNIADANAALALALEFPRETVCVAVKHMTPCGVAVGANTAEAYNGAYSCDPLAIFGGIVCFNRKVDEQTAAEMTKIFLEVIIAPGYSDAALKILREKKNLRVLALPQMAASAPGYVFKSVGTGMLIQGADNTALTAEKFEVVTKTDLDDEDDGDSVKKDLLFGMKVVKHVKSNAIVVAKNGRTLGIGGGSVSRILAAETAVNNAKQNAGDADSPGANPLADGDPLAGAVMASDALFPFPDVAELAALNGIKALIQPGGSKNDSAIIEMCDRHGVVMVMTGVRHFNH